MTTDPARVGHLAGMLDGKLSDAQREVTDAFKHLEQARIIAQELRSSTSNPRGNNMAGIRPITKALNIALKARKASTITEKNAALDELIELLDPMLDGRTGKFEPSVKRSAKKTARR